MHYAALVPPYLCHYDRDTVVSVYKQDLTRKVMTVAIIVESFQRSYCQENLVVDSTHENKRKTKQVCPTNRMIVILKYGT